MTKKLLLIYLIGAVVLLITWECAGQTNNTVRLFISSPTILAGYFARNYSALLHATLVTLLEAVAGILLATLFSFGVMVVCFYRPKFLNAVLPIMVASQVVPIIVLAPLLIVLFGIGLTSKIIMAAIISFFPIFVNFVQGYQAIPPHIHELMDIYRAPISFRIRHIYFPLSMPSIMAGLKIAATLSVIGAIVAEFTGARIGIGKNLFVSAIRLEPDLMMSSLILATTIGLLMYQAVRMIERRYGRWYIS